MRSFGKPQYYITITDDKTRYARAYFLHSNSNAVKVMNFLKERKNQDSAHVLRSRTDRGGEYVNAEPKESFASEGVIHEVTHPYFHESNGMAERLNRTIVTMARGVLSGLPITLWNGGISTAVYIKDHIPRKAIKESTPYEALYCTKPTIHYLQPFGRKCYAHVPKNSVSLAVSCFPGPLMANP